MIKEIPLFRTFYSMTKKIIVMNLKKNASVNVKTVTASNCIVNALTVRSIALTVNVQHALTQKNMRV